MNKINLLIPFLLTSTLISSCGLSKAQKIYVDRDYSLINSSYSNSDISLWTKEVKAPELINYMKCGESFILYVGSPTCSHCIEAKPNLIKWITSKSATMYYMNANEEDFYGNYGFDYLAEFVKGDMPLLESYGFGTPALIFFDGLNYVSKNVGSTNLSKEKTAANLLNSRTIMTNVYNIDNEQEYVELTNNQEEYLAYFIDRSEDNSMYQSSLDLINSKIRKSKTITAKINVDTLDEDDKEKINYSIPFINYVNKNTGETIVATLDNLESVRIVLEKI